MDLGGSGNGGSGGGGPSATSDGGGGLGVVNATNIPKLNGANYASWREMLGLVLELRGLSGAIKEDTKADDRAGLLAKLLIMETLDETHRGQTRGCKTAYDYLQRLGQVYADTSAANVYRLLIRYYRYEKRIEDKISVHVGKMEANRKCQSQS